MDYETKPISRYALRQYSQILRRIFEVPLTGAFPVLEALDKISDIFRNCNYEIIEDKDFSSQTMALCIPNDKDGFTIQIRESVYVGAYEKQVGAFLGFICHEICHIFLFKIGYTPVFKRSFSNGTLPAYRSIEWQAKALCSETMIPYYESIGMDTATIEQKYHVSNAFAKYRKKL